MYMIKAAGETGATMIRDLATATIRAGKVPTNWEQSFIGFTRAWVILWTEAAVPGRIAQSVTCLATDASLTAYPEVASSIPAQSHTFVEIDHEIISTAILLPSAESFKKGCCQLQAKVCARSTGYLLVQACPGKSVVK